MLLIHHREVSLLVILFLSIARHLRLRDLLLAIHLLHSINGLLAHPHVLVDHNLFNYVTILRASEARYHQIVGGAQ